jgi:hypothetical protein
VRVVQDINGRPNIIGDGINVAQRIMSFAQPNQILVSRSYYQITSRLTQEISQMFDYSGVKHDKHVRDHEVYSVRLTKDRATEENQTEAIADQLPQSNQFASLSIAGLDKINWNYAAPAVFVLVTLFAIGKLAFAPSEPVNIASKPAVVAVVVPSKPANPALADNLSVNKKVEQKNASQKLTNKKAKLKAKSSSESAPQHTDIAQTSNKSKVQTIKIADSKIGQAKPSHRTASASVTSALVHKCSQAQVAMGQCN